MTKRILITGMVEPKADTRALAWLARSIGEVQPDEIVCIEGSTALLDQLRDVFDGPIGVHGGSFEGRHRVTELPAFYDIAPGWISTGINAGCEDSRIAGNTALGAARRLGKSVVMGHTLRLGVLSETHGYGGKIVRTLTGMEVGHLVDLKTARTADRRQQQGYGLLTVDGENVNPTPIAITSRTTKH
ncbi:hypothetical protein A5642_25870 [Mycolicibacterium mucogenicum]|uniref:Uncharacterized protein n=1 Tax=Mycolicibacterium mucogenicum TaxID=56689 RepID=A0A1A0MGX6_MYCMU|nr:hypothetical protein [Mycolicibacterium mucogenicum]OBA84680.1 hypothetical protein A5642_25870 [Mycolicibacterium mucogenicum]